MTTGRRGPRHADIGISSCWQRLIRSCSCGWCCRDGSDERHGPRCEKPAELTPRRGALMSHQQRGGEPHVLLGGLAYVESPRWHGDRLWFAHWGVREVVAVDLVGHSEVVATGPPGLAGRSTGCPVDGRGNIDVNSIGFDFGAGASPRRGLIVVITGDGTVREVAGDIEFPNGMAITPDNSTLIVAESFAGRLTAFDIAADASVSTPTAPCGRTPPTHGRIPDAMTAPRGNVSVSVRAVRSCSASSSIGPASPVRWGVLTVAPCSCWPPNGTASTTSTRPSPSGPDKYSPFKHQHPASAGHDGAVDRRDTERRARTPPRSQVQTAPIGEPRRVRLRFQSVAEADPEITGSRSCHSRSAQCAAC